MAIIVLYLGLYKAQKALLPVTIIGLLAAFGFAVAEWGKGSAPIYNGMMVFDNFAVVFSSISIATTLLILLLSKGYFERISENIAEYYSIVLFSLAGIIVMVSYHNLTMLFIGVEIMSVSLYILAGIKRNDFASNEAALKYFLMGAFSTGFLLFGVALLYGASGSFDLDSIGQSIKAVVNAHRSVSPMFYSGLFMITVGLCFKVGVAPFHFWVPDVYEGSPSLITAFMSTVVKIAGFAAFLRLFSTCFEPLQDTWMPVLLVITILTLFVGNITALYQTSFKRMLAYSSISHAGYMLFAIVAIGNDASYGVFIYAIAYSAASVISFAALILLQSQTGSESFDSFNGLGRKSPFLAFTLSVAMLSFAGIPLTAGFMGKFILFSNVIADQHFWLVVLAVINAAVGVYYYFKVIIAMYFKEGQQSEVLVPGNFKIVLALSLLATIIIGLYPAVVPTMF
ncbi:MAG: NADH-quinone oxidoreductase subunit [Sphingobacteriaceae bacterium]|nr:NADH-quinone oxidoreductase subunit [Sphingobacteriaceae bacterium]